jgi:hypothetical protein
VCEQAHQQLKQELGLDHFEGRSWRGLHRHPLMALIAFPFLEHQRCGKVLAVFLSDAQGIDGASDLIPEMIPFLGPRL